MTKSFNVFEFTKEINFGKKNLIDDDPLLESEYSPWIINRSLSFSPDCVLLANEMNVRHQIDNKIQHDFLLYAVNKKKRFGKWLKHKEDMVVLSNIKKVFECSINTAREYKSLLTVEQIEHIKEKTNEGG